MRTKAFEKRPVLDKAIGRVDKPSVLSALWFTSLMVGGETKTRERSRFWDID